MRICPFCGDNVVGNHTDCRMNQPTAEQRIAALEREALPLCGEHQQYAKSHDGQCLGCERDALRDEVSRLKGYTVRFNDTDKALADLALARAVLDSAKYETDDSIHVRLLANYEDWKHWKKGHS